MGTIKFYVERIKAGRLKEMWRQSIWMYGYVWEFKWRIIAYTLLGMTGQVIALGTSFVSRDLVDIITGHRTGEVVKYFVMMIVFGIFSTILSQITNYVSSRISVSVGNKIQAEIFEKILCTDWESLNDYHTGDLMVRWGGDVGTISSGVLTFIPNAIVTLFRFASALAVLIYYDWTFALFAFAGLPVSFLLSRHLLSRMVSRNKESASLGAKVAGFNQEAFANLQFIKSFDLVRLYVERLRNLQQELFNMKLKYYKMSIWTSLLLSTVGLVVSYASYGWGIYRVWSGAITYGAMTMFLGLSGSLTGALHSVTGLIPNVISLTTSAGRVMDILDMPREDYSDRPEAEAFLAKNGPSGISLRVSQVSYAYKAGTAVFAGASMEAHPHEIIGLVGPSGEGKTTFLRLLLAVLRPAEGELTLCGHDDEYSITPSARCMFAYVPQGNTMFSGTIRDNLLNIKPNATEEEMITALKNACAWDFVSKMPKGLDSELHERGGGVSEGQSQRLSIARALLRKSPILLLDEATSALDEETENRVLENIMKDDYPRTLIVTSHRQSVIDACTRVYRIRDKKLVTE